MADQVAKQKMDVFSFMSTLSQADTLVSSAHARGHTTARRSCIFLACSAVTWHLSPPEASLKYTFMRSSCRSFEPCKSDDSLLRALKGCWAVETSNTA